MVGKQKLRSLRGLNNLHQIRFKSKETIQMPIGYREWWDFRRPSNSQIDTCRIVAVMKPKGRREMMARRSRVHELVPA